MNPFMVIAAYLLLCVVLAVGITLTASYSVAAGLVLGVIACVFAGVALYWMMEHSEP